MSVKVFQHMYINCVSLDGRGFANILQYWHIIIDFSFIQNKNKTCLWED